MVIQRNIVIVIIIPPIIAKIIPDVVAISGNKNQTILHQIDR